MVKIPQASPCAQKTIRGDAQMIDQYIDLHRTRMHGEHRWKYNGSKPCRIQPQAQRGV